MTEWLYYVVDHLDFIISAHETRHEAVADVAGRHDCNDYEIVPMNAVMALYKTPRTNRTASFRGLDPCGDERKVKA